MTNVKIKIEYHEFKEDDENILEIRFLRGETLIHNVFYNIDGLNKTEILELQKEAVAKFCTVFPELSFEDMLKGFHSSDEKMHQIYNETFGG